MKIRPASVPTLTTGQMKGLLSILADAFDRQGVKTIKRTRKRQIQRAAFMDHMGYEWSQWWSKRHGPRQLQVITTPSARLLGKQRGENNEPTTGISGV